MGCHRCASWCDAVQVMMAFLKEWEEKLGIKITCSQVGLRPRGSAGGSSVCDCSWVVGLSELDVWQPEQQHLGCSTVPCSP